MAAIPYHSLKQHFVASVAAEGKLEEMLALVHPDVVVISSINPSDPLGGGGVHEIRGADKLLEHMEAEVHLYDYMSMDIDTIISGNAADKGTYVVFLLRTTVGVRATGKRWKDRRACHVMHVDENGKLTSLIEYGDPTDIIAACRKD